MRIGSIGYATEQGLGHLMKWFYDAGVINTVLLIPHPRHLPRTDWYPLGTPVVRSRKIHAEDRNVAAFLDEVDLLLCFETPFDWEFVNVCRSRGVKTVLMPMYEWTPTRLPAFFDLMLCPSLLDREYFKVSQSAQWGMSVYLPVPVSPWVRWGRREKAMRFLHNAGHIGHREHKGTRQLLEALRYVESPLELTVRCQYKGEIERMMRGITALPKGVRLSISDGAVPYDKLWEGQDVYVAPEKFNGLSIPLQEAHASGLMVMTTDRFPANTWLPRDPLIPVARYERARISGNYLEFDEAVVEPRAIAATIDRWYGRDIGHLSDMGATYQRENSWSVLKPRYMDLFAALVEGRL